MYLSQETEIILKTYMLLFRMAPEVIVTETCKDDPYDYKVMLTLSCQLTSVYSTVYFTVYFSLHFIFFSLLFQMLPH